MIYPCITSKAGWPALLFNTGDGNFFRKIQTEQTMSNPCLFFCKAIFCITGIERI